MPVNQPVDPLIRLENVFKTYQEGSESRPVLKDACASFNSGEFIGLIGKSGSGKSTLLNIISGIDDVDSGKIWINNVMVTGLSQFERTLYRRKNIGFIFQFFNLFPTLNVIENITLPLELNGFDAKSAREKAKSLLSEVDLADRADAYPDRLSGGEQQRVAIARALIHDPAVVLADEPTGNLDEETGWNVLQLLDTLTREVGKNLIMATHSLDNAFYADRVFEIKEGKLVEIGPREK